MRRTAAPIVLFTLLLSTSVAGEVPGNAQRGLELSQAAIGETLPNLNFTRIDGRKVTLAEFRGKPLLVTLLYTSCVDVCPTLIESLHPAVVEARKALGPDSFAVISVGFEVGKDTPEQMRAFARARGVDIPNWSFLAADHDNLDHLARSVGFGIYARAGSWDHLAQVSLVDAQGRVRQQIYGAVFEPPLIVEPLKYLVLGRDLPLVTLDRLIERIKFFCTVYDASAGRYYFNYSLFMNIGIGSLCFTAVLFFLVREWRRGRGSGRHP